VAQALRTYSAEVARYAHSQFLAGVNNLALDPATFHNSPTSQFLERQRIQSQGGGTATCRHSLFDCCAIANFQRPSPFATIRRSDYLPEPDIFHDVAATCRCTRTGASPTCSCALAKSRTRPPIWPQARPTPGAAPASGEHHQGDARFFWFTIEFGLNARQRAVESLWQRVLSSSAKSSTRSNLRKCSAIRSSLSGSSTSISRSTTSSRCYRRRFVRHLFAEIDRLEEWMKAGKLNNVSPGEPEVNESDLESFLTAKTPALMNEFTAKTQEQHGLECVG